MNFLRCINEDFNLLRKIHNLNVMNKEDWTPSDFSLKQSKVEDLKFIFSQAKDRVKELSDEGDRIYTKSLTLVSVSVSIMLLSGGLIFSRFDITPVFISSVIILFCFWIIISKLKDNIFPNDYFVIGTDPKKIWIDQFFKPIKTAKGDKSQYKDKSAEWYLLYSEITDFQNRIDHNKQTNTIRKKRLTASYKILYSTPVIFLVSYGVCSLGWAIFISLHP
jgi:hypothetical protein